MQPRNTTTGVLLLRDVPFWKARPWLRRVAFVAYLYLGILFLLLLLENRFLYPGWWAGGEWQEAPPDAEDFFLTTASGERIGARWFAPPEWTPADGAFLLSHGNGGNISGRDWQARLWRKHFRQAVLMYDYPGYGKSEGRPTEAGCYSACEAAFSWLTDGKKVAAKEVVLLGESLGGAVSIELAARHDCRAVVTMGTFTSFPEMAQVKFPWLPARWLVSNQFDNLQKIGGLSCPVFIAHGTMDTLVPPSHAERLHAVAPEGSRLLLIEGLSHRHPDRAEFFKAVGVFLGAKRGSQPTK